MVLKVLIKPNALFLYFGYIDFCFVFLEIQNFRLLMFKIQIVLMRVFLQKHPTLNSIDISISSEVK
jgi:hypothetical protein